MKIGLAVLVLLLAGCAATPPPPPIPESALQTWQFRQEQLGRLDSWRLSGRVAINNGAEAWHLNVIWRQQADVYEIQLSGPFGSGQVRLSGSQDGVFLHDAEGHVYYADDPDSLLYEHTGVRMPVTNLRYWIRGLPSPDFSRSRTPQLDAYGRLAHIQQNGWEISMKRYVNVDSHALPDKLFIQHRDIEVRMVVDEWSLSLDEGANRNG